MEDEIKFDKHSEVLIKVLAEEYTDVHGVVVKKYMWKKLDAPFSLGSINKPTVELVGLEFRDTSRKKAKDSPFRLFGQED